MGNETRLNVYKKKKKRERERAYRCFVPSTLEFPAAPYVRFEQYRDNKSNLRLAKCETELAPTLHLLSITCLFVSLRKRASKPYRYLWERMIKKIRYKPFRKISNDTSFERKENKEELRGERSNIATRPSLRFAMRATFER